jgi:hypothetical protein
MPNLEAPFTIWQVSVPSGGGAEFTVPPLEGTFVILNVCMTAFSLTPGDSSSFIVNGVPLLLVGANTASANSASYSTYIPVFGGDVLFFSPCVSGADCGINVGGFYNGTGSE